MMIPQIAKVVDVQDVQLTESTSKKWKMLQLIGCVGIGLSFVIVVWWLATMPPLDLDDPGGSPEYLVGAFVVFALSLLVFTLGRVGAWWYHG